MEPLKKGTITLIKDFIFENGQVDRKHHRPTMIAISADSLTGDIYLLSLTSNVQRYAEHEESYYIFEEKDWVEAGLKVPSMVNLSTVYRVKYEGTKCGGLHPRVYKEVIDKLKKYKENHKDEIYEEIKSKL